jgi:hydroxymethylbilane synthase
MTRVRLGSRGSALALRLAELVSGALRGRWPAAKVELVMIKTSGDRFTQGDLRRLGGKGLFVKEIEEGLLAGTIDLAVHSLKDLPAEIPAGLTIAAFAEREDPRDVLIGRREGGLDALPPGARVGTTSLRRAAQLLARRPDLRVEPLRGNVDTRLSKLREGPLDAIVVAAAGLRRLGTEPPHATPLSHEVMLPAVGQGILALEIRADDRGLADQLAGLDHLPSRMAAVAERAFLAALGGDCYTPIAAYARELDGRLVLDGLVATQDGRTVVRDRLAGSPEAPAEVGGCLARQILSAGGDAILASMKVTS